MSICSTEDTTSELKSLSLEVWMRWMEVSLLRTSSWRARCMAG